MVPAIVDQRVLSLPRAASGMNMSRRAMEDTLAVLVRVF